MKKLFVAVAALATLLFVSCNKEANYPSLIQGTWEVKTATTAITKNGQPVTAETFIKDIAATSGQNIEIPEAIKQELQAMFDQMSKTQVIPEGVTITLKDGKVTAENENIGTYTLNGSTLTITAEGRSIPLTINSLTASDAVLTLDAMNVPSLEEGSTELEILKKAGYTITETLTFKKK